MNLEVICSWIALICLGPFVLAVLFLWSTYFPYRFVRELFTFIMDNMVRLDVTDLPCSDVVVVKVVVPTVLLILPVGLGAFLLVPLFTFIAAVPSGWPIYGVWEGVWVLVFLKMRDWTMHTIRGQRFLRHIKSF